MEVDGQVCPETVRSAECDFLVKSEMCDPCKSYRANLRALSSNHKQDSLSSPTKWTSVSSLVICCLNMPEKAKCFKNYSVEAKTATKKEKRLEPKLKKLVERGVIHLIMLFIKVSVQSCLTVLMIYEVAFLLEHFNKFSGISKWKL